jgi:hypothetical protein
MEIRQWPPAEIQAQIDAYQGIRTHVEEEVTRLLTPDKTQSDEYRAESAKLEAAEKALQQAIELDNGMEGAQRKLIEAIKKRLDEISPRVDPWYVLLGILNIHLRNQV